MGAKYVNDSGDHSIELGGGDGRSFDAIQSSGVYLRDDGIYIYMYICLGGFLPWLLKGSGDP